MHAQVLPYIRECQLLKAGDRVAVAVSGGADSVALLRLLLELRGELGIVLHVAHFNHQLRAEESDADERFVAELAACHDLPFFAGRDDVRAHAEANRRGLEHAAREMRYAWLLDVAREHNLDAVATAHNADDQAETVLMKFLRGAGTRGLAGIHPLLMMDNVAIIRPLLQTARGEIERYLYGLHQAWREDPSNRNPEHTRNRIRHELLPLLEHDYNPNLRQLLKETAEIARAEEDFWQSALGLARAQRYIQPQSLVLNGFEKLPVALQRRLLKEFLEREALPPGFHHVENLRHCALGESPTAGLPGGWLARREGDDLRLAPQQPAGLATGYEYKLTTAGGCEIPELQLNLRATFVPADTAVLAPPGSLLALEKLDFPLTVRNWLPGDRFRPAHSAAEEKLKRLFSEKKIPVERRRLWPVALNREGRIVWVQGFPVAHDFAWTAGGGNALGIEVLPQESAPAAT